MSNANWPAAPGQGMGGGYGGGGVPVRRPVSGLAVSSLVCSLLFCMPFVTSAVGALLGLVGVLTTGPGAKRSGRGIALAGLMLGVIGLVGWTYVSVQVYRGFVVPIQQAVVFAQAIEAGDYTKAAAFTVPPFDPETMPGIVDRLKQLGAFKELMEPRFERVTENGFRHLRIGGVGLFAKGRQAFDLEIVETPQGWRIRRFDLLDEAEGGGPTTQEAGAATQQGGGGDSRP